MKTSKPVKIKIDLLSFLSKIEESKVSTLSNKTQSQTEGVGSPSATLGEESKSKTVWKQSPSATLGGDSQSQTENLSLETALIDNTKIKN